MERATDRPSPPIPSSYWVIPGRFVAGEYPGAREPAQAVERLRRLLGAGIDCFIDLTEADSHLTKYATWAVEEGRRQGVTVGHERHAITDWSIPDTPAHMERTLDAIDGALADGRMVYLHCWGGVGRTGTVVGCWLVRHGMSGEEALAQIAEWCACEAVSLPGVATNA